MCTMAHIYNMYIHRKIKIKNKHYMIKVFILTMLFLHIIYMFVTQSQLGNDDCNSHCTAIVYEQWLKNAEGTLWKIDELSLVSKTLVLLTFW